MLMGDARTRRLIAWSLAWAFGLAFAASLAHGQSAVGIGGTIQGSGSMSPTMQPESLNAAPPTAGGGATTPFVNYDPPTSNSPMVPPPARPSGGARVWQAICWYIPNRIMDLTDIPRFHVALGDGQGLSIRATKFLTATWFEDNSYCLGWTKRTPPWFGEQIQERYLGFLGAQEGDLDRDPTEVGLSVHLLVGGANAAISLGEIADAAAGLVGIDLMADDHGPFLGADRTEPDPAKAAEQKIIYGPQTPGSPQRIPPQTETAPESPETKPIPPTR